MSKLDIPESWAMATLGDISDFKNGRAFKSSEWAKSGLPIIRIQNVNSNKPTESEFNYFQGEYDNNILVDFDDLLFCWSGSLGTSFGPRIWKGPKGVLNQHIFKVLLREGIEKRFYFYQMKSNIHLVEQRAHGGVGLTHITKSELVKVPFVIPPTGEQKRIVAKIESAQSKIWEIENCAKRVEELIGKYRQALLQRAFRGKLVPQDPNDEAATKLLDRIRNQRINQSEGKKKKQEDLPPIKPEEIPFEIPKSWEWVRLGNLLKSLGAGWSPKCEGLRRTSIDQWGVLKISAVSWGKYNPNEHKALPRSESPRPEIEVKVGQILLSRSNTRDLVARSVLVESTPPHLMLSDLIIKLECEESISAEYINIYHNSEYARAYYERVAKGASSTMCKVSRGDVQMLLVPLPPLSEQQQIVSALRRSYEAEEQFKSRISATVIDASSLMSSILTKAFQGKLVSQDPSEGTGFDLVDKLKRESFVGEKK